MRILSLNPDWPVKKSQALTVKFVDPGISIYQLHAAVNSERKLSEFQCGKTLAHKSMLDSQTERPSQRCI